MIQQDTFGPWTTAADGIVGAVYVQHNLVDARAQSWVLNVTASNMSPDEDIIPTTDILSFGSIGWMTENDSKYEITLDDETGFGVFVAPDCDIVLAYNEAGASSKTVTHVLSSASDWKWSSVANVTFTLSWDAETQNLSLEGGSVQRRAGGSISDFKEIGELDYNLPSTWLSGGGNILNSLVFISGTGASITTNLYTQGTEAGWLVSGRTELGTAYADKIAGTQREIGAADKVQFVGVNGIIYATETTSFDNDVAVAMDLQNIQAGSAIGFGADAGAELSVTNATNVINNAEGEALVPVLNIVGDGVVKLCYQGNNAANLSEVQVNIDKNATLKIDDSATSSAEGAQINLSTGIVGTNASIVKSGQATDLTIETELNEESTVISLNKLENENGSITISGPGSLNVQDVVTQGGDVSISGGASHMVENLDIDGDVIIDGGNSLSTTGSATSSAEGAQINLSTGIVGTNASIVKSGQATDLTIETELNEESTVISLNKLENENGSITISGPGSLNVQDVVTQGGDVSISGGASHMVENLDIDGDVIIDGGNSLSTTGDVEIAGEARVAGTLNTVKSARLTASDVTVQGAGVIRAREIVGNTVNAGGVTVGDTGSGAARSLLRGNVVVNSRGVVADEIVDGVSIGFSAGSSGTVTTGKMAGINMTAGGTQILTDADTNSTIVMSGTSTVASGTIVAASARVTDGYELSAQQLELTELDSDATSVEWDGSEYAVLEKVSIYNGKTRAGGDTRVMRASGITADTVTVQDDSVLIGPDVTASNAVYVGENAILEDVRINTSNGMIVDNGAALYNVSIQSGTMTNEGVVVLNNVEFAGGGASYGGPDGNAIVVDRPMNGVDNVQIIGALDGDSLVIDRLVVNAEALQFSSVGNSYEIMEGVDISYEPSTSNYQLNIEPFVRANLSYDDATGVVTISGYKDEYGIKNELKSTPNRQAAMNSLTEAVANAEPGTPLADINEYIGHVNRYSLAERQDVLDAVSGASLVVLADVQRRGLRDSQRNIRNRVIQMGGGTSAGLTTDWEYAGLQTWAQADASFTSTGGNQDECGYDFNTTGATVGANLDLTANLVVGMAFSASYGDADIDSKDYATVETSSYYLNFFGRYQSNRWVHMFIFTVGMDEMDTERRVMGYKANGNTEGTTYSLYYELGYTIGLDYENNHILQPLASVTLTTAQMSSFVERGNIGNAGLRYEGEDFVYGQLAIGARYQGVIYESVHERSAVLEARAVITHDIGDKTDHATLSYMGGHNFSVKGADSTGIGFEIGAGLSIPVEQHTTLFADADFTYAPEYTGFRANVGVRYDF